MYKQWTLRTHGDPLGTVRQFIQAAWAQVELDGMLVTMNGNQHSMPKPRLIEDPQRLEEVNPFTPLMTMNAARLVPELVREYPDRRLGALLRPCEMRALVEMVKHSSHHEPFEMKNVLTISVDCLGTYPLEEYQWRLRRKESSAGLAQEALQFARQGGIIAYRYRSACQACPSPAAGEADVNVNVLGLPARQSILVKACDEAVAGRLRLEQITDGDADAELIRQHERVVAKMVERHQHTMERVTQSLAAVMPADVNALIAQLEGCGSCQNCMNVCPICSVDYPKRGADNHYRREDVIRWLVSCAGCGMCEQSCTNHLPLSTIFAHIRAQLDEEYGYQPGRSVEEALPVV